METSRFQTMQEYASISELLPSDDSFNWMRTLVRVGAWVATADPSRPLTAAVCLPRVEFAGLLVASGACIHAVQSPMPVDWRAKLGQLVDKRVAYSLRENPYVYWEGILRKIEPNDVEIVSIQGTKKGPADRWPLADMASIQFDPERDGQELAEHYRAKTAFRDEHSQRLRAILPEDVVGKLCSWWLQLTLVGTRSRIADEMSEPIPWKGAMSFTVG